MRAARHRGGGHCAHCGAGGMRKGACFGGIGRANQVAVAAPGMPGLATVRSAADLAALPLIADKARQGWHDWFRAAGVHGATPRERYQFSDTTDAMLAAALGLGVALARERILTPFLTDGRLRLLDLPGMPARWSYFVVYPAHRQPSPAAQAFIDWLLADVADFGP